MKDHTALKLLDHLVLVMMLVYLVDGDITSQQMQDTVMIMVGVYILIHLDKILTG